MCESVAGMDSSVAGMDSHLTFTCWAFPDATSGKPASHFRNGLLFTSTCADLAEVC